MDNGVPNQKTGFQIESSLHRKRQKKTKANQKMKTKKHEATAETSNLKRLAGLYKVCTKTMAKMINSIKDELGDRGTRRLFYVNEVEIIFSKYGTPKIDARI
jgi:hypothetical protein